MSRITEADLCYPKACKQKELCCLKASASADYTWALGIEILKRRKHLFFKRKNNVHLLVLRFNIQVNNFLVLLGWNHRFLGINQYYEQLMCLAQGHKPGTLSHRGPSRFLVDL